VNHLAPPSSRAFEITCEQPDPMPTRSFAIWALPLPCSPGRVDSTFSTPSRASPCPRAGKRMESTPGPRRSHTMSANITSTYRLHSKTE